MNNKHTNLSSQQYTYLTIKQFKQQISKYSIDYDSHIKDTLIPYNKKAMQLFTLKDNPLKKQQIIYSIVKKIKSSDSEYKQYVKTVKQRLNQNITNLTNNESKKSIFMTDCLRESMSYPWKKQNKKYLLYNFNVFFKQSLKKQTRRILWQKMLINQLNSSQFYEYNHQITPYNIQTQFMTILQKLSSSQDIVLKESQKDLIIKLLQYILKKSKLIPNRTQIFLCLNLIDLFSYYQVSKIQQIGSIFCGLENLAQYYFQPKIDIRINNIFKAFELVDEESYQIVMKYFFENQDKAIQSKLELNQIFEHFRLSFGSKYLPFTGSQYIIDQLLIKKRNKFDIYIVFAIVMLVLGDHIQNLMNEMTNTNKNTNKNTNSNNNANTTNNNMKNTQLLKPNLNSLSKSKMSLKTNNNTSSLLIDPSSPLQQLSFKYLFHNSRKIIRYPDLIQSFRVIYQKIPPIYSQSDIYELKMYQQQPNLLFEYLLECENNQKQFNDIRKSQLKRDKKYNDNYQNIYINDNIKISMQEQQLEKQLEMLKRKAKQQGNNISGFVQINDSQPLTLANA